VLSNVHKANVRQTKIHTAESLVREPQHSEDETASAAVGLEVKAEKTNYMYVSLPGCRTKL
jgi:hypothetical protein